MTESVIDLVGHRKRVGIIQWHPTANNILASTGTDNDVIIWDVEKGSPVYVISGHSDQVTSMTWNKNGSLLLTTSKDKKTRVIDPRKSEDQILHVSCVKKHGKQRKFCFSCFSNDSEEFFNILKTFFIKQLGECVTKNVLNNGYLFTHLRND